MKHLRMLMVEPDPEEAERLRRKLADEARDCPLERLESVPDFKGALAAAPDLLVASGKRLEQELATLHEQSRKELDEVRKQCAKELAELARRKDDFLAALSHELRNPLGPIRNSLHLLRLAGLRDHGALEALSVLDRQVQCLGKLVDDLLDVFRIRHGKLPLRLKEMDLAELLRAVVADQRTAMEKAGLHVELSSPDSPVWVQADAARITQIVTQLVTQSAKPNGRVEVKLTVDRQQARAVVTIHDDGDGVAPEALPSIFDFFAQSDRTLERRRGGLGLGLALVKMLVELHGGGVQAASPGLGQGTAVEFWLPLLATPAATSPSSNGNGIHHSRVLIVEDNKDAAATLRLLLRAFGHEVEVAETGPEGLDAARRWRPEVVLCDIGIPEMNGFEVARALREDPRTSSMHLIAVSGYGQEGDRRRAHESGFELHLTKPVDPDEIHRLLISLKTATREPGLPA